MENTLAQVSVYFGTLLILVSNVIWYRTKITLKKKGYDVGWINKHFDDYPNLLKAIGIESSPSELKRLTFHKNLMLAIWVLYPLGILLIFSSSK
ncbi:MAG: hypothetical protein COA86_08335 [Kangiella sp.]|nr:MAG: hypothetical protein COA86_08335 [Kangiella sp.]